MAATNYTPIQLYHSTTASAVPVNTNLVDGELAINITDGKLYYKDNGGTVRVIATKATGTIGGSDTQVQYNSSGSLAGSSNFTFNGTTATINTLNLTTALGATYGGTAQTTWTAGDLLYASGSNTLAKLAIGLNTYILTSNGTIPGWAAPSTISVSTATNLAGGAAGSVPYQSGAGATTFLSIGTANQVVTSTGTAPQWSSGLSLTTLTASDTVTFSATTQNLALGTSQTSGTWTAGGAAQTGTITLDQSTKTHTLAIGTGATESGATKTINLGTAGVSGSTTTITIGSANGTSTTLNGTVTAATLNSTTIDTTNLEVTNVKAKDGTAAIVLTDSTGAVSVSTALTANGGAVFNENGANVDFRVEGDTDANLIFADASADFVGIGTNAPGAKLDVAGNIRSTGGAVDSVYSGTSAGSQLGVFRTYGTDAGVTASTSIRGVMESGSTTSSYLEFLTTASGSLTTKMLLNSAGNLGLGVTTISPWDSGNKFLEVNATAAYGAFGSTDAMMVANAYWNGSSWVRKNANNAFRFVMETTNTSPTMNWGVAANGAQGSTFTFTQAMTLDASGNLLVGTTTSAGGRVNIVGGSLAINQNIAGNANSIIRRANASGSNGIQIQGNASDTVDDTNPGAYISVGGGALTDGFEGNIYITAYGNTAGGTRNNIVFQNRSGTNTVTERARITSDGDLLIGTTGTLISGGSRLRVTTGLGPTIDARSTDVGNAVLDAWNNATSGDNIFVRFWTEGTATQRGSITYNRTGGLVAYNTTSDYRAKDILGSVTDTGATIDALKVYNGKMKGATVERPMLIAHEAQEVAPYAVTGEKDAVNEDGTPKYQQMDVSSLVPLLIAEIQSLRARVAQLEQGA